MKHMIRLVDPLIQWSNDLRLEPLNVESPSGFAFFDAQHALIDLFLLIYEGDGSLSSSCFWKAAGIRSNIGSWYVSKIYPNPP